MKQETKKINNITPKKLKHSEMLFTNNAYYYYLLK